MVNPSPSMRLNSPTAWTLNATAVASVIGVDGAFMFCYRQNESVLRFSYVSESWSFASDGSYKKDSTDTRRFTYLLGEGHRSRTAIQQFASLKNSGLSLKDLTKAFSVEAVGRMFFDDYKQQYCDCSEYDVLSLAGFCGGFAFLFFLHSRV